MNFQDCVKFANEHRICFIATEEGYQPRVRPVRMWFADKTGFYFQCGTYKPYYKQLRNHNKVEICFPNEAAVQMQSLRGEGNPGGIRVMRVAGDVEFLDDDMELRARCMKDYPGIMKELGVTEPEDPRFAVFRLYTGEAYFWTRDVIGKEAELEKIKF